MSNFPLIGDAPLDGGVVVSVDGRIGIVTLDDLYAIIGHTHTSVEVIAFLGYTPEDSANKGAVNGYAGLDGAGKVPLDQLPGGIGAVTSVDTRTGDVTLDDLYEDLTDKGVANGYAGLDGTGKVPLAQLPDSLGAVFSVDTRTGDVTLGDLYEALANKNAALGYPGLDAGSKISAAQIPDLSATYEPTLGYTPEDVADKNAASGYAGLDAGSKISAAQIPDLSGTYEPTLGYTPEDAADKNAANGYPGLDAGSKISAAQIPDLSGTYEPTLGYTPEDAADKDAASGYPGLDAGSKISAAQIPDLSGTYEPTFSKNTGFNKNFGSASGDVAEGDKAALLAGRTSGQYLITESKIVIVSSTGTINPTMAQRNSVFEFTQTGGAATFQIQLDSTLNFPTGSRFPLRKSTAQIVNITKVGGVTFRGAIGDNPVVLSGQDGYSGYIEKTAADTWLVEGAVQAP